MKQLIVQISGKQGSGKTSLANSVQKALEEAGVYTVQHTYAKILYHMHQEVLKVMSRYYEVPAKDGKLFQLLGTEWGRSVYGKDVWIDVVRKEITHVNSMMAPSAKLVHLISDLRFPNEAEAFPGALLYRLECPVKVRKARIMATPGQSWREGYHESECAFDGYVNVEGNSIFTNTFNSSVLSVEEITKVVVAEIHHCLFN